MYSSVVSVFLACILSLLLGQKNDVSHDTFSPTLQTLRQPNHIHTFLKYFLLFIDSPLYMPEPESQSV